MEQFNLACELARIIRHFFPGLVSMLRQLPDPRHQGYITYPGVILLMTRILSAIFYISSMRKTSEELNSDTVIENVWELCGESPTVNEIPYWETINRYLEKLDPDGLQDIICRLCERLIRGRAFEDARIRGNTGRLLLTGHSCTAAVGSLMTNAFIASIIKGRRKNTRKATIMCWRRSLYCAQGYW